MIKIILSPLLLGLAMIMAVQIILFFRWTLLKRVEKCVIVASTLGTVIVLLLSLPITAHYLYLPLHDRIPVVDPEDKKDMDVIVVLMGGDRSRIIRGIQAYKKSGPPLFIISGKIGNYSIQSVKQDSWALLALDFGVPLSAVRGEYNSKNTYEHPLELLKMSEVNKNMKIGIVTSSWHMPRALSEFNKYFSRVIPIPSGYKYEKVDWGIKAFMPQADALYGSTLIIHEYIGSFWYRLRYGEI